MNRTSYSDPNWDEDDDVVGNSRQTLDDSTSSRSMAPPLAHLAKGLTLCIAGYKVEFPVKPYDSQVQMMTKILLGLKREKNCLIESPTGSGKSLALLCASLAWLQTEEKRVAEYNAALEQLIALGNGRDTVVYDGDSTREQSTVDANLLPSMSQAGGFIPLKAKEPNHPATDTLSKDFTILAGNGSLDETVSQSTPADISLPPPLLKPGQKPRMLRVPKIYYGTRTHRQIAQVVREMNKTSYRNMKMTILASREHTCIHPQVSEISGKNEKCKELMDEKYGMGCRYYTQRDRLGRRPHLPFDGAWDLEDFVALGKERVSCPYFAARMLREDAHIVFCPYNYLIDPLIRRSMEIDLKGQIVILDEAHNLEDNARDAVSGTFLREELAMTMDDLDFMSKGSLEPVSHGEVASYVSGLLRWLDSVACLESISDTMNKVMTGRGFLHSELEDKFRVRREEHEAARAAVLRCVEAARMADEAEAMAEGGAAAGRYRTKNKKKLERRVDELTGGVAIGAPRLHPMSLAILEKWFLILDLMLAGGLDDYCVAVTQYPFRKPDRQKLQGVWGYRYMNPPVGDRAVDSRRLHLWCLNPALAFVPVARDTRNVILTSGTLSPIDTFSSELGVNFDLSLEANHVIGDDQVFVDSIPRGPSLPLLLTYKQQTDKAVILELGTIIRDICTRVPKGVLVFFPSYKMMQNAFTVWFETAWDNEKSYGSEIERYKRILIEPKDSNFLINVMEEFRQAVNQDVSPTSSFSGALLLAVFRGKVSEGVDFANDDARAVITIGVPFPNTFDPCIKNKMVYNDSYQAQFRGLLPGRRWYEIQAFRALNQALGRCIRHKNDWGALIIIDQRFQNASYVSFLPRWVRERVRRVPDYSNQMTQLTQFVATRVRLDLEGKVCDRSTTEGTHPTQLPPAPSFSQFRPGCASTQYPQALRSDVSFAVPQNPSLRPPPKLVPFVWSARPIGVPNQMTFKVVKKECESFGVEEKKTTPKEEVKEELPTKSAFASPTTVRRQGRALREHLQEEMDEADFADAETEVPSPMCSPSLLDAVTQVCEAPKQKSQEFGDLKSKNPSPKLLNGCENEEDDDVDLDVVPGTPSPKSNAGFVSMDQTASNEVTRSFLLGDSDDDFVFSEKSQRKNASASSAEFRLSTSSSKRSQFSKSFGGTESPSTLRGRSGVGGQKTLSKQTRSKKSRLAFGDDDDMVCD